MSEIEQATPEAARQLTDRIKTVVGVAWELIAEAFTSRAWAALGYGSWDKYCDSEFGSARLRLPREERQEVVGSLREAGLSMPAIAAATGLGYGTVHRELAGYPNGQPAGSDTGSPAVAAPEDVPGEAYPEGSQPTGSAPVTPPPAPTPPPVITGSDGRRYPASRPAQPPRPSAPPQPALVPVDADDDDEIITGEIVNEAEAALAEADARREAELDAEMNETAARFRRNFSAALARADDVWQFDVERIAELYSADFERDLRPWLAEMERWCQRVSDTVRRSRSGLRVVQGGVR